MTQLIHFFHTAISIFGSFKPQQFPSAVRQNCFRIFYLKKCICILALEMASPGNRHCANCIGAKIQIYVVQIKYTDAISSNRARKLLRFEITEMLMAVLFVGSFGTLFVPCALNAYSAGRPIPQLATRGRREAVSKSTDEIRTSRGRRLASEAGTTSGAGARLSLRVVTSPPTAAAAAARVCVCPAEWQAHAHSPYHLSLISPGSAASPSLAAGCCCC